MCEEKRSPRINLTKLLPSLSSCLTLTHSLQCFVLPDLLLGKQKPESACLLIGNPLCLFWLSRLAASQRFWLIITAPRKPCFFLYIRVLHLVHSLDVKEGGGLRARSFKHPGSREKVNVCRRQIISSLSSALLLLLFSDSNAIKAEGLQEGLDWLQGNVSIETLGIQKINASSSLAQS